jgi:hypothetical protein
MPRQQVLTARQSAGPALSGLPSRVARARSRYCGGRHAPATSRNRRSRAACRASGDSHIAIVNHLGRQAGHHTTHARTVNHRNNEGQLSVVSSQTAPVTGPAPARPAGRAGRLAGGAHPGCALLIEPAPARGRTGPGRRLLRRHLPGREVGAVHGLRVRVRQQHRAPTTAHHVAAMVKLGSRQAAALGPACPRAFPLPHFIWQEHAACRQIPVKTAAHQMWKRPLTAQNPTPHAAATPSASSSLAPLQPAASPDHRPPPAASPAPPHSHPAAPRRRRPPDAPPSPVPAPSAAAPPPGGGCQLSVS